MAAVPLSKPHRDRGPCGLYAVAAAIAAWLTTGSASAQQSGPAPVNPPADIAQASAAPAEAVAPLVVVGKVPAYRSTMDRRSYSIADDLRQSTGSLADVLRDVPSVQVDTDGEVSLRGDPSVTILVDGKPSALFSGPGRAQALQSMSPDQFARVEVMTNPPAGVTAEGSGGVINLISKTPPKGGAAPTARGTAKANIGSGGRFDVGADGVYSGRGLSLNGGFDLRRGGFTRSIGSRYELPTASGALTPATGLQLQSNREDALTINGSAGYDLDARDHLDASISAFLGRMDQSQTSAYQTSLSTGPDAVDYTAPSVSSGHYVSVTESLGLTHALPGDGQSIAVNLSLSQTNLVEHNVATYAFTAPAQPDLYQDLSQSAGFPEFDLKVDYKKTLPNKAKLTLGYEGKFDWQSEENHGVQGPTAALAVPDTAFAQTFRFDQQVHAVYATYDQTVGKLDVQPGLRLETVSLTTDLLSSDQQGGQTYFEAYPSLHLTYELNDTSEIKASYGRRAERPDVGQLDPFRVYSTPTLYNAGNPDLKPAITQSFELGVEFRKKTTDLQATLFYRDKSDLLTTVTKDVGDDVLVSTWQNLGRAHDLGLELVANRDIVRTFNLSASVDLKRSDVDAANLGIVGARSAFIVSAQLTAKWKPTPKDVIQLSSDASGRQLNAQGYRGGAIFSNLGWKHQFNDRLAAVFTADNPFGLSRRTIVIDTPTLDEVDKRKFNNVAVFVGLTYALGAKSKSVPSDINFNAPQGR